MPRRTTPKELGLFGLPHGAGPIPTPHWRSLPVETQPTLTGLMVRLILDHADGADSRRKEAGHDAKKIGPHHLERKEILYLRQSSAHEGSHNRESSTLKYAMRDRLVAFGWSTIETIDNDLGRSAAGGVARAGFDRIVVEVCLR